MQSNPILDWAEAKHESELAQSINQCKSEQARSQIKQRRDVKAFQKELAIVRAKIDLQKKEKDMIKKLKKQTKSELKDLTKKQENERSDWHQIVSLDVTRSLL